MSAMTEPTTTTDVATIAPEDLAKAAFDLCWQVHYATIDVSDIETSRDVAVWALMFQTAKWFNWDLTPPISQEEQYDFEAAFLHYVRDLEGDVDLAAIRAMRDLVEECAVRRFSMLKWEPLLDEIK